jgi:hypothetical protein
MQPLYLLKKWISQFRKIDIRETDLSLLAEYIY